MLAGVSAYCFHKLLVEGSITLQEIIRFLGEETEAQCFETLSRYWNADRGEVEQARQMREQLDAVGLRVSCYTLDTNFGLLSEQARRDNIDQCIRRLETAQALGADVVRVDPCSSLPNQMADTVDIKSLLERIAKGVAEVCDAAADAGVKIGAENHGRLVGGSENVLRLVEMVGRPNFGVNIDFTNFRNVYGEDHVEATRRLAPYVVHAHAKDFYISLDEMKGEDWSRIPTGEYVKRAIGGEGDADWLALFTILKDAGYQGTISLEISIPGDERHSVAQGVANIRKILRQIGAHTPDA